MVEATLALFVVVFAALVIVLTRLMKPRVNPVQEKSRLQQQIAQLEQRQLHAAQNRGDEETLRRIDAQLAEARSELAKLAA